MIYNLNQIAQGQDSHLIRLTGLWKNKNKNGIQYLIGNLSSSSKLLIISNSHKVKDSDPDYIAYLAPQKKGMQP